MESYIHELDALLEGKIIRQPAHHHHAFTFNGQERMFSLDARTFLEGALSCTLLEELSADGIGFVLRVPEKAHAKAKKLQALRTELA